MEKKTPTKKVAPVKTEKKDEPKQAVQIIEVERQIIAEPEKFITYSREQLNQIKTVYAKGATDIEFANFILVSARTGLDIFKKQIYLVPRWDSKLGIEIRSAQAGIDGFRAVAERTGNYAGNDDAVFKGETAMGEGKTHPDEALVTVYKIVQGVRCPFTATARWNEYYPGDKVGFMWKTKPHIMLGKCAEALALRKAFPNIIQGFYESAELDIETPGAKDNQKAKTGLEKIKEIVSKMDEKQIAEYASKIEKSDKYNDEQRAELAKLIEERLVEINKK